VSKRTFFTPADKRFSRKWWLDNFRAMFWVVLVTILIWVYADIEFTEERTLRATIELTVGNSEKLVLIDESGSTTQKIEKEVSFELKGSAAELDKYRRELTKMGMKLSYDLSESHGTGNHTITLDDILNSSDRLTKAGIVVQLAEPASIEVTIDEIVEKSLPVKFQYHGATVEKHVIDTEYAKARATRSDWQRIEDQLGAQDMVIHTKQVDLSNHPSGEVITAELLKSIAGAEDIPILLEPASVKVTVDIAKRFKEINLKVTVRVMTPYIWTQGDTKQFYTLKTKDSLVWVKEITVTGPTTEIEALKAQDIDAYIVLSDKDLTQGEIFDRPVQIRFPSGSNVKLKSETPTISFTLEKVPAPG